MTHQFTVEGMTCGHCEAAVTRAIKQLDAAAQVSIDRAQKSVRVESGQPREALAAAIREGGPPPGRKRWSKRKNGRERADQQRFFAPLSIA